MKLANISKIEGSARYFGYYEINGLELSKIQHLVKFLCSQIEEIEKIEITFPSDHAQRVEPLSFKNYIDLEQNTNSFSFKCVESIGIHSNKKGKNNIGVCIDVYRGKLGIGADTKELEEEIFEKISTEFFSQE